MDLAQYEVEDARRKQHGPPMVIGVKESLEQRLPCWMLATRSLQ